MSLVSVEFASFGTLLSVLTKLWVLQGKGCRGWRGPST